MFWRQTTKTAEATASSIFGSNTSTTDSGMRHFTRPPRPSERLIAPAGLAEEIAKANASGDPLLKATASITWKKFCEMIDQRKDWFDVSALTDVMEFYKVRETCETRQVRARLRLLHCNNWDTFDKELLEALPNYINFILSEGTYVTPGSETVVDAEVREVNERLALP